MISTGPFTKRRTNMAEVTIILEINDKLCEKLEVSPADIATTALAIGMGEIGRKLEKKRLLHSKNEHSNWLN